MQPQEPVLVQGVAFVLAGLTGVAMGLATDTYRALCSALRPPRWMSHTLDVTFVVLAVPVVAAGLLAANWGALRVYPLAALLLGFGLYLALASPVILPGLSWSTVLGLSVLRWTLRLSYRTAAWPVRHLVLPPARALGGVWRRRTRRAPTDTTPPIPGPE